LYEVNIVCLLGCFLSCVIWKCQICSCATLQFGQLVLWHSVLTWLCLTACFFHLQCCVCRCDCCELC